MAVKTKRTDKGRDKILREMMKMRKSPFVKIGVIGEKAKDKTEGDALRVVDVAVFNEFGTETIPERAFIRVTARTKRKEIQKLEKNLIDKLLRSKGSFGTKDVLGVIGVKFQALIQKGFTEVSWTRNSKRTISKKGSSQPLIDTGQLRQSISWKVVNIK